MRSERSVSVTYTKKCISPYYSKCKIFRVGLRIGIESGGTCVAHEAWCMDGNVEARTLSLEGYYATDVKSNNGNLNQIVRSSHFYFFVSAQKFGSIATTIQFLVFQRAFLL